MNVMMKVNKPAMVMRQLHAIAYSSRILNDPTNNLADLQDILLQLVVYF